MKGLRLGEVWTPSRPNVYKSKVKAEILSSSFSSAFVCGESHSGLVHRSLNRSGGNSTVVQIHPLRHIPNCQ